MTAKQPYPTRRQLRKEWEKQQESQPLTRKEIRRRQREEEARLAAIATGELTITGEVAGIDVPDGELMPPRPPRKPGEPEPTRRSLREEALRRSEEEAARSPEQEPVRRREDVQVAEALPAATLPTRRSLRESQQSASAAPPAPDLPLPQAPRNVRFETGVEETAGEDNRDDVSGSDTQSWRRRVVTPPATAQGVKVLDHATGEIRTLRPEEYTAAQTRAERELTRRIEQALPPVVEDTAQIPPPSQPVTEPHPQPQRVSLFDKVEDLPPAAPAESETPEARETVPAVPAEKTEDTRRANHPFEPVSSSSEPSGEPTFMTRAQMRQERQAREEDAGGPDRMSRPTKIILAILAIAVLAVVVWLVWSSAALAVASATVVVGKYEGEMCLPLLTRRN